MAIARQWDGAGYDRVSTQMETMGREVLDRLPLRGDETVLDAGCGSGRVTAALIGRLPRGRVIGVDGSESMVAACAPPGSPRRAAGWSPGRSRRRNRPHT
jgi:trans-aconitate methyltransferase